MTKSSPSIWRLLSECQIDGEDFADFCGLLRKLELKIMQFLEGPQFITNSRRTIIASAVFQTVQIDALILYLHSEFECQTLKWVKGTRYILCFLKIGLNLKQTHVGRLIQKCSLSDSANWCFDFMFTFRVWMSDFERKGTRYCVVSK